MLKMYLFYYLQFIIKISVYIIKTDFFYQCWIERSKEIVTL